MGGILDGGGLFMRYSDDIIEEVRSRNDIVDVISQYVKLTKKGSSYFGLCPFHNEKTPSFSVTPGKQMYYCFGCGAGGNVFNLLWNMRILPRRSIEIPGGQSRGGTSQNRIFQRNKEKAQEKEELLRINKEAAQYYYYQLRTEKGTAGYQYLTGRGLSDDTIRKFGLGYSDKYGSGLYRYLKTKEYSDERLRDFRTFQC